LSAIVAIQGNEPIGRQDAAAADWQSRLSRGLCGALPRAHGRQLAQPSGRHGRPLGQQDWQP